MLYGDIRGQLPTFCGPNGEPQESGFDRQQNSRIGATAAVPLGHGHMLKLAWAKGASVRVGQDFSAVGLTYQYRWF